MKKFLLGIVLLLSTTGPLFGQATNGFHRTAIALARAFQGVTAQVVPNAKVTVTATATGLAATIYSDPALTSVITPAVVTADNSGNYGYYIPLGYCVTETITAPGQGTQVITNVCNNNSGNGVSIQTNSVSNASQTNLNFTDTATVKFTNPGTGVESATVPNATNAAKGVVQCDGTTTSCSSGVISSISGGIPAGSTFSTQYNNSGVFGGTGPGTSGQVLTSNGAGSAPTFQATSGVQYNPSNTLYLFAGPDSIVGDDSHLYGTLFTVTSFSCDTGVAGVYTCTVNTSTPHGLTVGTWVTPENQMTGWPGVPAPFAAWTTPYDLFQITAVPTNTSLQYQTTWASVSGISGSGGTIEDASYFMPVLTSKEPFFNGHGSIRWSLPTGSTIVSMNTNYATVIHPVLTAWQAANPGATMYVIITGGRNDLQACTSLATLETDLLTVAASAHTDGAQVIFNTITPSAWNNSTLACSNVFFNNVTLNNWAKGQLKVNATTTGQYFDRVIDQYSVQNDLTSPGLTGGGLNGIGRAVYAKVTNEGMSTQDSAFRGYPSNLAAGGIGGALTITSGPMEILTNTGKFARTWVSHSGGYLFGIDDTNGPWFPANTGYGCMGTTAQGYPVNVSCATASGMTSGQVGIANGANSFNTSKAIQGTDTNLLSSGTVSGTGATLCTDANGGATTTGCSSGTGLSGMTAGQVPIAATASTVTSSKAILGTDTSLVSGTGTFTTSTIAVGDANGGITTATALPNGTTATTQSANDNSTKVATTAYVDGKTRQWSCQPGLGDGLNAIAAGTYLQSTCMNTTGATVTLTGLKCFTDNAGTSTMNAAGNTLGALLTGAVTCSASFAAGTQSANVALTNGDYIKFTFVADGTSKQTTWIVTGTY